MIVLDEQLQAFGLKSAIAHWYRGTVTDITQLRRGTLIDDDEIPALLRTVRQPTFVTINVSDFWLKVQADEGYFIACVAVTESRTDRIPGLLRRLFRLEPFHTRKGRLGKVARITSQHVDWYFDRSWSINRTEW